MLFKNKYIEGFVIRIRLNRRTFIICLSAVGASAMMGYWGKRKPQLTVDETIEYWLGKYKHHHPRASGTRLHFASSQEAKDYLHSSLKSHNHDDYKSIFLKIRQHEFRLDQAFEIDGYQFAKIEVALLRLVFGD